MGMIRRLYHDDRGAMGVLLLLLLFALIALIGLIWNSGEYATRRQHVQNAADSTAHAAETWMTRTTNVLSATNMLAGENASAEIIWRSVDPTAKSVGNRLDGEENTALRILRGANPGTPEVNVPDVEYFEELLGMGSWSGQGRGATLLQTVQGLQQDIPAGLAVVMPHLSPQVALQLQQRMDDRLRRSAIAAEWLGNTWILGQAPAVAGNPAAVNGGLQKILNNWVESQIRPRLLDILGTLPQERDYLNQFIVRTAPGLAVTNPDQLAAQRATMFEYEQNVTDAAHLAAEEQRQKIAAAYKVETTYALPVQGSPPGEPAVLEPPVENAGIPEPITHADSIRPRYPIPAAARFGTDDPVIQIDAINVNVENSCIWHRGVSAPVDETVRINGQVFTGTFGVGGGEWGQIQCAPLALYVNRRLARDEQGLRPYMQSIDQLRSALRSRVYPVPTAPRIPDLPYFLRDSVGGKPPIPIPPEWIPQLPVPATLTAQERQQVRDINRRITAYNRAMMQFVNELENLADIVDNMYRNADNICNHGTENFADWTWLNNVDANRYRVLLLIGWDKAFMVLKTYDLRYIPTWAQPGVWDSAQRQIYNDVYGWNIGRVTDNIRNSLENWLIRQYYDQLYNTYYQQLRAAGMPDRIAQGRARQRAMQDARAQARPQAAQLAPGLAQPLVQRAADYISREVADEWIRRPWPYEIDPPQERKLPPGLTPEQRKEHFTMIAAARSTEGATGLRLMLPRIFNQPVGPLVAYAQSENFNWMEFQGSYGAGDAYDRLTDYGHRTFSGAPAPWRLSTIGGWSWQTRLSTSDALNQALVNNPQLQEFFASVGLNTLPPDAVDQVNLH